MRYLYLLIMAICLLFISSCTGSGTSSQSDNQALSSWNEGKTKSDLMDYIAEVTDPNSPDFVPEEHRIACFDNDGTMWAEQPVPSQIFFSFNRIKELASEHPEWKTTMPYQAIIENDTAAIGHFSLEDVIQIVGEANKAKDIDAFEEEVRKWFYSQKHPVLNIPYKDTAYKPMLKLIAFLQSKKFKTYIVSGGSKEFMRPWMPKEYGIPTENIIGTTFKREVESSRDSIYVVQTADFQYNDDKEGKVLSINEYIGKKPIMVFGNSDGDVAMMQYASTENQFKHYCAFIHHDDEKREFDYSNEKILYGQLDKGKAVAEREGWTFVSMKNDWNTIFPNKEEK